MFRLPRNSFEFNTDPNKGIDYILSAIRALQAGGGGGVTSFNTRTGAVTLTSSDVTTALGYTPLSSVPTLDQVTTAGNTTTNNVTVGSTFIVGDWTSRPTNVYVRAATGGAEERGYYIGVGSTNTGNGGSLTYNPTTNLLSLKSPYNSGTTALSLEGNTNSVQFHNTSGTVVSKFVSSTGNLLINTTTDAGYKLDVNGNIRISGTNGYVYGDTTTTYLRLSNAAGSVLGYSTSNIALGPNFVYNGAAVERFRITTTGNVGIGTSSPVDRLDVEGNLRVGVGFQLRFNNANVGLYRDSNDLRLAGYTGIQFLSSATSMTAQTERMRINGSTGNVLIGTTTDAGYKLDVNGTARVTGQFDFGTSATKPAIRTVDSATGVSDINGTGVAIIAGDTATGSRSFIRLVSGSNFNASSGSNINHVFIGRNVSPSSVGSAVFNQLQISAQINQTGGANGITRGLYINPTLTSAYDFRAIETSAGNVVFNGGNVGIGTTTPEGPLHVKYSSSTLAGITIENDGVGFNAGSMTLRSGTTGGVNMSVTSGGGLYWYNLNTTSNTLSLPATGNLIVGGAVDAGYRLDVQGGDARFAQNVEAASYSVAGNAGYSGIVNFPGNPPGSQNLEFLHGILINVF